MERPAPWTSGRMIPSPFLLMSERDREEAERRIREEERRRREELEQERRQRIEEERKRNQQDKSPTDWDDPKSPRRR